MVFLFRWRESREVWIRVGIVEIVEVVEMVGMLGAEGVDVVVVVCNSTEYAVNSRVDGVAKVLYGAESIGFVKSDSLSEFTNGRVDSLGSMGLAFDKVKTDASVLLEVVEACEEGIDGRIGLNIKWRNMGTGRDRTWRR